MHLGWYSPARGFHSSARKPPPVLKEAKLYRAWSAEGQFWLPDAPQERLWGRLEFRAGEMPRLKLEGSFWKNAYGRRSGIPCPIVYGRLFNGAPCTLFDGVAYAEVYVAGEERFERLTLFGKVLAQGEHFPSRAEALLQSLQAELHPLNDWVTDPYEVDYEGDELQEAVLRFKPAKLDVSLDYKGHSFRLALFCGRTLPSGPNEGEVRFVYTHYFQMTCDEPAPLDWHLRVVGLIRECLMFLTGEAAFTSSLRGFLPAPEEEEVAPVPVDILLPVLVPMVVRTDRDYLGVSYGEVAEQLPRIFQEWFRRHDELEIVVKGYAELLVNDGAPEETMFLRVCQVLEHFHGIVYPESSKYLPRAGWRQLLSWLTKHLPEPLPGNDSPDESAGCTDKRPERDNVRMILISRIGALNQLSFRSKLSELMRGIVLRELFPILDNPPPDWEPWLERFLAGVEATRHYLTHFDERQRVMALKGREMEVATTRLFGILAFWLARSVGIDEAQAGNYGLNAKRAMFLIAPKTSL